MTSNFGKNQDVANTLDTYLLQEKPRFAIMLQGKWGSGKTWFIHNYINKRNNKTQPFCYVSLFGLAQLKEIDSQILACCNSTLSKAVGLSRLAGSIIERCNPVIKEADVEKIGDFIKNLCKVPDNLVLVLDDLERTSISMELILGYVSNMMDDVGIKVILLCDQNHIPSTDDSFLCFKEKVVGSTVAVIPDIEAVFECQLAEIKNEKIKNIFHHNKDILLKDFISSKTDNLRNIKRIIYEFSICYEKMNPEMRENMPYLRKFLHTLFIFLIEINGGLSLSEFYKKNVKIWLYYENPDCYKNIDAVSSNDEWYAPVSTEFIEKIFYSGIVDEISLCDCYNKSEYSKVAQLPIIVYHKFRMGEIDDSEAIKLHELICEDIANTKYTDVNTLLHAFDIMLKFSLIGLGKQSVEDIINLVKEYLTTIKASKELSIDDEPESTLKFLSFSSPYFSTIYRYICEYAVELRNEKINGILQEICQLLPASPDEFIKRFPCDHIYYPVSLVSLDAKDFAQKIAGVPGPKLRYIMDKIYYNIRSINEKQSDDIIWTNNFIDALTENLPYMPPVARHIANITLQQFKESVFEKWPTPDDY